MTEEYL